VITFFVSPNIPRNVWFARIIYYPTSFSTLFYDTPIDHGFIGWSTVDIMVYFEENKDLVNFEVGQEVNVEGVLQDPYINLSDHDGATGSFCTYWINSNCSSIVD